MGYFFRNQILDHLSVYLAKSEKVKANILIVEGWLPNNVIENAYNEFQKNGYDYIITTGIKSDDDYYRVSMNGYLNFYPDHKFPLSADHSIHTIEISAYSEMEGIDCAHFNLFINDSLVSDFYANRVEHKFLTRWEGELNMIDSIRVQFDNDKYELPIDRNLYVKEVIIDNQIRIPFLNNSIYDIRDAHVRKRVINNFNSNAEKTRNELFSMGIDSARIKALPGRRTRLNRTLSSALAVRDWLETTDRNVTGINIVSVGTHARRDWMIYNRVLKKSYNIGIISLPDNINNISGKTRSVKTIRETLAIIYYWFILVFY